MQAEAGSVYHSAVEDRYSRTAVMLHWVIALAVLGQIAFGWYLQTVPRLTPDRAIFVNFHKSTGLVIGVLILFRIAWRLTHTPPPLPASMPAWEQSAARVNHALLYVCMLVMPVAGYTASNFSKFGVKLFNAVLLPPWGVDDRSIYAVFNALHVTTSYIFVALIAIHVTAALRHLFFPRHGIFRRMLPS
jgi:cytochrome b561